MSDTINCPNCSATLPAAATFCTSCGTRTGEAAPAASTPPPADDATRLDNPGLTDATQVYSPPPAAPWQPAESSAPPGPPPAASWNPPAAEAPAAPPWQQPQPPAPSWGAPPANQAPQWGAPPAAAPSGTSGAGAPLGAIAAVVGGLLSLIGLFTAWFEIEAAGQSESFTGWSLASGDDVLKSNDPYLILAAALAAIVVGVLLFTGGTKPVLKIAAVVVGLVLIATPIRDWLSIVDIIESDFPSTVKATQAFGFFLTIAGGVITAAAAVLPGKKTA